jgi:hypothetical protein
MKKPLKLFALVVLVHLTGCAQLRVGVDVLDREFVRGEVVEEGLRQAYRRIASARPRDFAASIDRGLQDYRHEVGILADKYMAWSKTIKPEYRPGINEVAEGLKISLDGVLPFKRAQNKATEIESLAQVIRQHVAKNPWSGRSAIPPDLRTKLVSFESAAKQYGHELDIELRDLSNDAKKIQALATVKAPASRGVTPTESTEAKELKIQQAVVAAVAQRSIIEGSELTNTEFAYIVASAPELLWAPNFNQALGNGTFGNVDIVIKMNSTADFSVKGMRFDATTVATVASKVMTQAVLLGAQMSGVPIPTASSGTTTGGDALSKSSSDLAVAEASLAKRQAQIEAQRSAIRTAAKAIIGARSHMEDPTFKTQDAQSRAPLHKSIDSTLKALQPLILMQDIQ